MTDARESTRASATTMRAIVQERYGSPDVLDYRETDRPVIGDDEVLVRVRAASVSIGDWAALTGKPYLVRAMQGMRRPKRSIPGRDMSGEVVAVGKTVTQFQPGDEVYGEIEEAFAQFAAVQPHSITRKPSNLSFEEAAAVPSAGLTALQGLRDRAGVRPGQQVLINGASGGVGTFAIQVAKALGGEVTGVCSTRNVDQARSLGADHVIDYTMEDFAADGHRYDVVFDLHANRTLAELAGVLTAEGIYVSSAGIVGGDWFGPLRPMFRTIFGGLFRRQKMVVLAQRISQGDLEAMRDLIEDGKVRPVVERTFSLSEVPEALRRQGGGHARGKSVITM